MAGLGAGAGSGEPGSGLAAVKLARQQMAAIAWLRWRIFVNTLRGKGAMGELAIKIVAYPFLALIVVAPSIGSGFASWYLVATGMDPFLAILLWILFAIWQFVGVSTSTTGPSFDLSILIRFPIRYRDYFLIRLSFGLLDPPTLIGIGCLIAMSIGIGVAAPVLFPWAAAALLVYAICNILFSRMVYSWIERWLAQRRTRELITGFILLASLLVQVGAQMMQRLNGHHAKLSPAMMRAGQTLIAANWFFPPGLAASSIQHMHEKDFVVGVAALGGLLAYTAVFLFILHKRLYAQYMGEDLSEAPAGGVRGKVAKRAVPLPAAAAASPGHAAGIGLLPAVAAACLIKEIRYLLRSGPKLYALVMPVFMVFIFSARNSGMSYTGLNRGATAGFLFTYGCVYLQFILVGLIYNSLGSDAAGIQLYFLAPIRIREVLLGKNLLTAAIMAIEVFLIFVASSTLSKPPAADLIAATLTWLLFSSLLNVSIGNVRSIVSPRSIEAGKVRRQNASGLNTLISLGVTIGTGAVGAGILLASHFAAGSYWPAAGGFSGLAMVSLVVYLMVYRKLDQIALDNRESLAGELCKA